MDLMKKLAVAWLSLVALIIGIAISYYWPESAPTLWVIGFIGGCIGTGVAIGILVS